MALGVRVTCAEAMNTYVLKPKCSAFSDSISLLSRSGLAIVPLAERPWLQTGLSPEYKKIKIMHGSLDKTVILSP